MNTISVKPASSNRPLILDSFNCCKGIAILGILFVHCLATPWNPGWQGVHVFIILSGFGLTYSCLQQGSNLSWQQWYPKRFRRILPAYWLVAGLGYLLMVILSLSEGDGLLTALSTPKRVLFAELTLLGNFFYGTVMKMPNVSLWFVPFIVSFYLVFPFLYQFLLRSTKTLKHLLLAFILLSLGEFIYRAVVMQGLDAFPIGGELLFDRVPDWFPFQREAPFGLFAARMGEFAVGMVAALLFCKNQAAFERILLNRRTVILGIVIWLLGNAAVSVKFWGWIVSDFLIGLGLILWLVNLAHFSQRNTPKVSEQLTKLGNISYYLYLVHYPFIYFTTIYLSERTGMQLNLFFANSWLSFALGCFVLACNIAAIWLVTHLLQRFDRLALLDQATKSLATSITAKLCR